jgi:tRNA modification GTPase
MIELHLHGSRAVVAEVFRELARLQFSVAKRGEFTRRAVINNRMNLQQAEAVGDLVESHLEFERQVAVSNLVGKNKAFLDQIRQKMIRIVTVVEAFIEFEEE